MRDAIYLNICVVVTCDTAYIWGWPKLEARVCHGSEIYICTADAVGLAAFAVLGAQKAAQYELPPLMWIVSWLMSACFGGIIQDLLCLQQPRIMYPHRTLYGPPAVVGSAIYAGLVQWSYLETQVIASIAFLVTFVVRVSSFDNPRGLPHWKKE
jgi:uncharacterized membrane protein YeiH